MITHCELLKGKPVYQYNGRYYQITAGGVVLDVSAVTDDPHFPGMVDVTDAICNVTYAIERAVKQLAKG